LKKIIIPDEEKDRILILYSQGFGYRIIHKILKPNYSEGIILRYLRESKAIETDRLYRKYEYNKLFFKIIDNEEKAYWLGFLYADGNVSDREVRINLNSRDRNHLEKFLQSIEGNNTIEDGIQNSFGTITNYSRVSINSIEMIRDLTKLGCIPRKSQILKYPNEEQVPKYLINHFIRGYLDGDGSIIISSKNQWSIGILGTELFLKGLKEELLIDNEIGFDKRNGHPYLNFGGNLHVLEILSCLYENSKIYLDRKYNRYLKLKSIYSEEIIKERSIFSSRLRK